MEKKKVLEEGGEAAMGEESRKNGPEGWLIGVKSSPDKTYALDPFGLNLYDRSLCFCDSNLAGKSSTHYLGDNSPTTDSSTQS